MAHPAISHGFNRGSTEGMCKTNRFNGFIVKLKPNITINYLFPFTPLAHAFRVCLRVTNNGIEVINQF